MKKIIITYILVGVAFVALLCWSFFSDGIKTGGLPVVSVVVPEDAAPVVRNEWTKDCNVKIYDADGQREYKSPYAELEGRGHSTADKPKRPYNIKLDHEMPLFGMPVHDKWVLLAGFFDHSLMKNWLGAEVARQTSLASTTPQGRFVTLELKGNKALPEDSPTNQGVYYMCERVKDMVGDEAVLLEFDAYAVNEDQFTFRTNSGLPVSIRSKKDLTMRQLEEVKRIVNEADDNPIEHIDFDTFADYYLVQELCQNGEPNGPRSCFMHLLPNGKLAAGPVWDFDLAFITVGIDKGNDLRPMRKANMEGVRLLTADSLYNANALWYGRLLNDPAFASHVRERWQMLKPRFEKLTAGIDSVDRLIRPLAEADQKRWNATEPARFDTCTTYASGAATLKANYLRRIEMLQDILNNQNPPKTEPGT